MSVSRDQNQLFLGPSLLPNREQAVSVLPKREHVTKEPEKRERLSDEAADALWSAVVSEAIDLAGLTNGQVAFVLDKSESLVRKMRSTDSRECLSHRQMLQLAWEFPDFYPALNAALDARTHWLLTWALRIQQQVNAVFALSRASR